MGFAATNAQKRSRGKGLQRKEPEMTSISSILTCLMDAIDGWTVNVLSTTVSDIEARTGKDARESA